MDENTAILLIAEEQHSARILLRPSRALALETKQLPKNKYFPEALTVECPSYLLPWPTRVAPLPHGTTVTTQLRGTAVTVQRYTAEGKPLPPLVTTSPMVSRISI
ncbi:hypothetical protein I2I05_11630 [Hymenobacter sp. BT683]|uniref:Uncharacterized protein n=1 Tax=Hymenobacter jeongseonensis TaxID=2791027 RepID=A0ABS0II68_9BACT|nr:hypothetical protein [Hymenobacter jeongseonensis]MBF9238045.1 hypothetical protein [Hymenobacter jeongseonensis]